MLRKLLFGLLLFNSGIVLCQLNPGNFEIRLVDLAGNQIGVEMRAIMAGPAPHGDGTCTLTGDNSLFLDIIFTLKCATCESSGDINDVFLDNCTNSEMEFYGYSTQDQAVVTTFFGSTGFYLHPFGAVNTPYDAPEDWPVNVWKQIVVVNHAADINPATVSVVSWDESLGLFTIGTEPNISLDEGSGETAYTPAVQTVLPLDLLSFKALKYEERSSLLQWTTVNEINTSHFIVERSTDLLNWQEAGKVQAAGESAAVLRYEFLDLNVYDGRRPSARFYYRLNVVDGDGRAQKSNIEVVKFGTGISVASVYVFPNPSSYGVNIELNYNTETAQPAEILMYNDLGQMVYQQFIPEGSALEFIDYSKTNIYSGAYTLQVMDQTNGILATEKIIVQR